MDDPGKQPKQQEQEPEEGCDMVCICCDEEIDTGKWDLVLWSDDPAEDQSAGICAACLKHLSVFERGVLTMLDRIVKQLQEGR